MTQKTTGNRKSGSRAERYSDVEFRDLALTPQQEKKLVADQFSRQPYLTAVGDLLAHGYKLTLKVDARNSSIMAIVQDAEYDPQGTTVLWVMRSGTASGALLKLCYYLYINEGSLPDALEKEAEDLDDSHLFA